jgi:tRNA uridine 5-carboxymethylaminomethyl modification enzyme
LPEDVQFKALLRSVVGFEKVKFFRPDTLSSSYFPPTQLKHTLETKIVESLIFRRSINELLGYEERFTGLMAGISVRKIREEESFILPWGWKKLI